MLATGLRDGQGVGRERLPYEAWLPALLLSGVCVAAISTRDAVVTARDGPSGNLWGAFVVTFFR